MEDPTYVENMMSIIFWLACVLFGGVHLRWPYKISRHEEQLDAIGSKRSADEVEPADWKVLMTKAGGAFIVLLGLVLIGGGLIR